MTRTRRGIADDDGSDGEVPQFKISRLNRRHIWPAKPCNQCMALLRCMSPLWHEANISRCLLSAFGGKADISARIDHGYGSTRGAYGHPTRLAAKCVWSPERLATTTPRTTVASVRCRSRRPPTRKLTTLRMAVTAITFWRTAGAAVIASTYSTKV